MTNISVATTARQTYDAATVSAIAAGKLDIDPDVDTVIGRSGERGTSALPDGHRNKQGLETPGKYPADVIVDFPAVRMSRQVDDAIATFGAGNVSTKAV